MKTTSVAVALSLLSLAALAASCSYGEMEPEAPEMVLDVGSEETYTVGEDVVLIHITATDPQDMELEFDVVDKPDRADFTTYRNQAIFNWDPIASDVTGRDPYRLVFQVTNQAGLTTERTVNIHIEPGNSQTRFVSSSSHLYDPKNDKPLTFDVEVESDEAPQVILSMPEETAPEGASFEQTENFEGRFEWMPSSEQRQQRIHHVVFQADDDNDIVEQEVTVVMQDPDAGSPSPNNDTNECSDDSVISHAPLEAQRTAQPYPIEGSIDEGAQDWQEVLLYWTFDDPLSEEPEYETEPLEFEGGQFAGEIPNPHLDRGEWLEISYAICAYAAGDDEDGVACAPEEFLYRFNAYSPDEKKCFDDGVDMSEPDKAGDISLSAWEPYRVCDGAPKHHRLEAADGESVEVAVSFPAGVDPKIGVTLDEEPVEVEMLPCIGLAYATTEGPGEIVTRVAGDELPYHITGFSDGVPCADEEYEPNDSPDRAVLLTEDFEFFEEMTICEEDDRDVFALELVAGDEFDSYMWFDHDKGDLDMTLFSPSQFDSVEDDGIGVEQGWSTDNDEWITHVAEESGLYFFSVITSDEPNDYELMVERYCGDKDEFSGNHTRQEAAEPHFDTYEDLKLCEGLPDYYRLTHNGSEDVTWVGEVHLEYGSTEVVDVAIYNEDDEEVGEVDVLDDRIEFAVSPDPYEALDIEIESSEPSIYELVLVEFAFQ